ncbi:MAG: hypothetical protein ACREP0_10360 [Rhodanobacteraceae bacterium]
MPRVRLPAQALCFALATLLAGCVTFHPLPLDNGRGPQRVDDITVSAASMPTP